MPTPPPHTTTITDSKFNALKTKLRELFELDKSDLDFGIYRIIAAKNNEVTEFLDRQLKDVVRATLAAHGAGAADQAQAELDKAIEQARTLGADPETLPKVKELRASLDSAGGAAGGAADLEADIYNHLLAFFGRYYDEGDFISKRRYKGDTYAIPYSGEEVTLHWANKDQYYIKSGEWHKDYRFKPPHAGDKTVRFKLVEATQEVGNNKEADDAKRRYVLALENPVEETAGELSLRFEFRAPKPAEFERAAAGAVAIFGGDYAKPSNPKKGDEREQFCADAEKRAIAAMSAAWKGVVATLSATESKPARTNLGKHLDDFTARNTFDYFIHKDLGGFLRRELDFYIKNEVVRLDDLENLPPDHLQRVQGKVKAIRTVASRLIAFLASLEDFQKKMWLKKKFVLNTNWLVTVDRIPSRLRDVVAANETQWREWKSLGFKPEQAGGGPATTSTDLFGGAAWGTRAYLDAIDKLVVDTRFFDASFIADLLSSDECAASAGTIHDALVGTLVHGENSQALRLLEAVHRGEVGCVYIDPPYNTDASPIVYKNGYRRSTWTALLADRLHADTALRCPTALRCIAIDDFEYPNLQGLLDVLGSDVHHATAVVRSKPQGRPTATGFSSNHEYAVFWGSPQAGIGRLPRSGTKAERYPFTDDKGIFSWANFRKSGTDSDRVDRRKSYYPVFVLGNSIRIPTMIWNEASEEWTVADTPQAGESVVWPIDTDGREKVWTCSASRASEELADIRVGRNEQGHIELQKKYRPNQEGALPGTWWDDSSYSASESGTKILKDLFGPRDFDYPKSLYLVADCIRVGAASGKPLVLDYFAGSGTTAHAVLHLNREDQGRRRFILMEMGFYFETVLRPRVTKTIYCPDWKDAKAQTHNKGVSSLVKYFALESYEDALNNLPAPSSQLLDGRTDAEKDALITYALDLELGPSLLNLEAFRDPWGYTINAQLAGDAEIKRHRVDLVETFNYLLGLKVHAYGPLERYSADFERAPHADGLGRTRITGRLRRDAGGGGPFMFQRVEGELNDGNATRVLVVWRKLTDDPEKDAAALDAWMARHREDTRQRTQHRDYHLIYINGPVTLPQPTAEIRTVFPIEETFKIKMFEDTDSASQMGGANG